MDSYGLGSLSQNEKFNIIYGSSTNPLGGNTFASVVQPITGYTSLMPANKNSFIIIQAGNGAISDIMDNLHEAQELARALSVKYNTRFIVFKACWSCAPKADLNEEEL